MKTEFIQKSPILEPGRLDEKMRAVMVLSLKQFKQAIKDHQVSGRHTGKPESRGGINGGVFRHVPSRPGESPSPITMSLVNSTTDVLLSDTSGEIQIRMFYGGILQNKMERDITITPAIDYRPRFFGNVKNALEELL